MEDYEIINFEKFEDDYIFEEDFHQLLYLCDKQSQVFTSDALEKAGRFIFAEDLVSYIALKFHGLVYSSKVKNYSELVCYLFNENVKNCVNLIRSKIINCSSFEIIKKLCKSCKLFCEVFIDAILGHYSEEGLTAETFLCLCVYFAELATNCYRPEYEDMLEFGVYGILDAFCMFNGGKYELNNFANCVAHDSKTDNIFLNYKAPGQAESLDREENTNFKTHFSNKEKEKEFQVAIETRNEIDKIDKNAATNNLAVDKMMQQSNEKHNDLHLSIENNIDSVIDNLHVNEPEILHSQHKIHTLEDFLKEVMSVVSFEASLFSQIYLSHENRLDTQNEKVISQLVKDVNNLNIEVQNAEYTDNQSASDNFVESEAKILPWPSVISDLTLSSEEREKRKCMDFSKTFEHHGVKFPNTVSQVPLIEEKRIEESLTTFKISKLIDKSTEYAAASNLKCEMNKNIKKLSNSIDLLMQDDVAFQGHENEDSTIQLPENIAESQYENSTKGYVALDCSIVESEAHNFVNSGCEVVIQTPAICNIRFTQQENESAADNFTLEQNCVQLSNLESKDSEIARDPVITKNTVYNDKHSSIHLTENVTQLEHNRIKDFDSSTGIPVDAEDHQSVVVFALYKREGEIGEENLNVLKGDALLFAENLVKYISKEFYGISYSVSNFDEIRHFTCNKFNDVVKEVANFYHHENEVVNGIVFDIIANEKERRTDYYRRYVAAILSHYVEHGLNSDAFLYYCLHFSELASKLYALDIPDILDYAICSILDAFCLLNDDWNKFNTAVENVLNSDKFKKDCVNFIIRSLKELLRQEAKMVLAQCTKVRNEIDAYLYEMQNKQK